MSIEGPISEELSKSLWFFGDPDNLAGWTFFSLKSASIVSLIFLTYVSMVVKY